jgi:hypothetical protein
MYNIIFHITLLQKHVSYVSNIVIIMSHTIKFTCLKLPKGYFFGLFFPFQKVNMPYLTNQQFVSIKLDHVSYMWISCLHCFGIYYDMACYILFVRL